LLRLGSLALGPLCLNVACDRLNLVGHVLVSLGKPHDDDAGTGKAKCKA
jgi:hypothetical protein